MSAKVAEIPRVPIPLQDAPVGDTFQFRGGERVAAAIERAIGKARLRREFGKTGKGITFDHGDAPVWRPNLPDRAHHIHWQPQDGLRFKYESYQDHVKLTIYADERYGLNTVTYQGTVDSGLVYRRRERSFGAVWELVEGDAVVAFHPPPKAVAGGRQIPAGLSIVQSGQQVTYTITLDAVAAAEAYAAGHVIEIDPTTVDTSTSTTATAYNNQRKVDRTQAGRLWLAFNNGSDVLELWYSSDNGQTWTQAATTVSGVKSFSIFIDVDDYMHLAYDDTVTGSETRAYYRRGTLNGNGTDWSWSAAYGLGVNGSSDGIHVPDIIAHREGTGWKAHVGVSYTFGSSNLIYYNVVTISSGGAISVGTATSLEGNYGTGGKVHPTIDFNHDGGGKAIFGSPHLYMAWTTGGTGAGKGIRFAKATYSAGSWTWGTIRELDSNNYANGGRICGVFDGSRFLVAYAKSSSTSVIEVLERDAADTTTTSRTPTALSDGTVENVSITYDDAGDIYLFASGATSQDPKWVKYDRAGGSWGSWTTIAAVTVLAGCISAKRGYFDGSTGGIEIAYTEGSASPYNVVFDRTVSLNQAPSEPTLTASPTAFDAADGTDITIQHNDPDSDDMSAYALKRDVGGTVRWWDAATEDFSSETEVWNAATGTSVTIAKAKNAANWTNETTPNLYAATKDAAGTAGPYNATAVQVKVSAKPVVTITSPADAGTVSNDRLTVEWTYTDSQDQKEYRVRLLSSADAELWSSGWVASKTARSRTVDYTLTNNTSYKVEVTVKDANGVESAVDTNTFTTSFTSPLTPTVTLTPDADTARIRVVVDNKQVDVTTEGGDMTLAGGATASGTDAILDAQNEEAYVERADLATGKQRVVVTASDSAQVANDLRITVMENEVQLTTATKTLTGSGAEYTLDWDATAGRTYRIRVIKDTATANTITIDSVRIRPAVLTSSNKIQRRVSGAASWDTLKTDVAVGGTYDDYSPGSGITYEYRAVALGENDVEANGTASSTSVTFENPRFIPVNESGSAIRFWYNWSFRWRPEEDVHVPQTRSKYRPIYSGPTFPVLVDIEGDFVEEDNLKAREWKERILDVIERRLEGWLKSPNGDVYRGYLLNPGGSLRMGPKPRERIRLQFRETKSAL